MAVLQSGVGTGFGTQVCEVPSQISPAAHWLVAEQPSVQMPLGPQTSPVGQGFVGLHCGLFGSIVHAPLVQV
jgi:hypothetical protein